MRYVTFFYNSMTEKVSDLKVHNNKGNAARYFNENGRKYFNQFTPITIDTLPAWGGSLVHRYYLTTVEDFEEAFDCSIDEALKLAESEE